MDALGAQRALRMSRISHQPCYKSAANGGMPYSITSYPSATMPLSSKHVRQLQGLIKAFEGILADAKSGPSKGNSAPAAVKRRRTGKDLVAFRKMLATERKGGMSVVDLATKYGVTTSYIYQLPATFAAKAKPGVSTTLRKVSEKKSKRKPSASTASGAASDPIETAA